MSYGDINGYGDGKGGGRRAIGSADFYRRVPKEMTEVRTAMFFRTSTFPTWLVHQIPLLFSLTQFSIK